MDLFEKYLASSFRFLSFRSRSEKELRDYLKKRRAAPQVIERIITQLKELKFLDDLEFAKGWVRSRTEYKPRSVRTIKMELKQKGIADELIEEALAQQEKEVSDKALAIVLLQKRKKRYEGMEKNERLQKAGGFLARKGFNFDVIKSAITEVFG